MTAAPSALTAAVLALAVVSAAAMLVVRHRCGLRGRIAHLSLCAAMAAMAAPALDVPGPLFWTVALGSVAYWVAGASRPVADRLPVLCDLVCAAALVIAMPLSMARGAVPAAGHHHGAAASGPAAFPSPMVLVALWAAVRVGLWWRSRGSAPPRRAGVLVLAEAPMAAAMILMVW